MLKYKKSAALAVCLCLCASAAVCPVSQARAEEDSQVAQSEWEEEPEIDQSETAEPEEIESGDYSYIVTDEGTACLTAVRDQAKDLTIPDMIDGMAVTEMGADIFAEVSPEKVHIPATIEYIYAENCFSRCEELTEITVDEKNENYCSEDGILYTKDKTCLFCYPQKKTGDSFTVPENVTKLAIASIYGTQLKEIKLHSGITELNRHTFALNEKLESIDMSMITIEKLPVMICAGCSALTDVQLPQGMTEIGGAAFMSCSSLENITIPDGVLMIGQSAFMGTAIMKVRIPSSVRLIDYCAFGYDDNEVAVPGFTIVGETGSAAEVYSTDKDADYGYKNEFEFVPVEADDVLEEYKSLDPQTSGDYQYSILNDNEAMLLMCTSSDDIVEVPSEIDGYTITSIFKGAFLNCYSKEIVLPETVKTIGEAQFGEYLETLTIPGGCESIEGVEPFINCTALKAVNVTEGNGNYASRDGVLFSSGFSEIILYPHAKTDEEFTAPEETESVAMSAFCGNNSIKTVSLPNVKTIGNYAFDGCGSLESVKLSDKLESVGDHAFYNCLNLPSIRLGANVTEIGDYAVGFIYDEEAAIEAAKQQNESGSTQNTDFYDINKVKEGFKIYTDKDTTAYQYADHFGIEVVTGTISMGDNNVSTGFLYTLAGIAGAAILAVIGVFTGKSIKAKKKNKKPAAQKKEDK
ncbi:MAG: leucine-rich repeat protein [Ruminococcus sp.]|nr:leucine-rich repeat protein [Ruminococcus sp.]